MESFSESQNSELFYKSSLLQISNIFIFSDWAIRLNQFRNLKDSWSNVSLIKNLHSCQCLPYLCSVVVIKKKIFLLKFVKNQEPKAYIHIFSRILVDVIFSWYIFLYIYIIIVTSCYWYYSNLPKNFFLTKEKKIIWANFKETNPGD